MKISLIIIGLLITVTVINAQYKVNKTNYNFHTYSYQIGDPYNPTVMGFASLVIPGFGQMLSGEGGRGIAFLGGNICLIGIKWIGIYAMSENGNSYYDSNLRTLVNIGKAGIHIWAAIDASRVAKVNSLVFRDKNNISYNLRILPYFGSADFLGMNEKVPFGLTLSLTF
jgi:hypothetical protein